MASDPGFYDVLGEDEPIAELPYPQEYDYLWTEERDALNLKWDPFSWFRGAENRQAGVGLGTLATALVVGIAYTGVIFANSLLAERPKLENDAMCGITTGGQASSSSSTLTYLIFVIFFTRAKFLENKIYTEKRHFFALNL